MWNLERKEERKKGKKKERKNMKVERRLLQKRIWIRTRKGRVRVGMIKISFMYIYDNVTTKLIILYI